MELSKGLAIGPYRLLEPAGSGGMADVWRAFDVRLERHVAIKFLSPRFATDPTYLERFRREARAVSRLDHPNILTVHDFGEQDGWTYMVSPFIGGGTLATRLRRGAWTVDEAITVLEPLASALDHAHEEGLVHRDVKPSNVLFTDRGRLVLTDFGIARMVEGSTLLSQAGLVVGTPMYMSPEQADARTVGPASDLYSLGVVAYEMLTGRPPFIADTPLALLRAHIDKSLPPPCDLNPALSEAAEAALFKIMAKNPVDRHTSGSHFIDALRTATLQRASPSVHASSSLLPTVRERADSGKDGDADATATASTPTSSSGQSATSVWPSPTSGRVIRSKGTRAHRLSRRQLVLGIGGMTISAVAGLATSGLLGGTNTSSATVSPTAVAEASQTMLPSTLTPADPLTEPTSSPVPTSGPMDTDGSGFRTLDGHTSYVLSVAFSPDGRVLASGAADKSVRLWQADDGSEIRVLSDATSLAWSVAFAPDGKMLASEAGDRAVRLWRVADGSVVHLLSNHASSVMTVAFSPDGQLLASGSKDSTVGLWRVANGEAIRALSGHTLQVMSVAFSPDGQMLASGSEDRTVRLWRVTDGTVVRTLTDHKEAVNSVAFSPDGRVFASGANDSTVRLWRVDDGSLIRTVSNQPKGTKSVTFSPDGRVLASGASDGTVRLWRIADGTEVRVLSGHTGGVNSVTFSPDGRMLASGSDDRTIRLWRVS